MLVKCLETYPGNSYTPLPVTVDTTDYTSKGLNCHKNKTIPLLTFRSVRYCLHLSDCCLTKALVGAINATFLGPESIIDNDFQAKKHIFLRMTQ